MESYQPTTLIGIILIVAGILLVILPIIALQIPNLEKIPWIIIWTYKTDNFLFATSPLLIIITVIFFIFQIIRNYQ